MAHKTFISYKYSEATGLRDAIIKKMGSDATYYQGETSSCRIANAKLFEGKMHTPGDVKLFEMDF